MTEAKLPSGIILDELDASVRPQDDLFRHVNGAWMARTEIPDDKARFGSFVMLHEKAEEAVHSIIEKSRRAKKGSEARKVGDLYTSFMDEQRIDLLGASPIASQLLEVSFADNIDSFLAAVGRLERQGVSGFVQLFVDNDPGNPERYSVFFEQGGIGLPDESYFREEQFAEIRHAYVAHMTEMFELAKLDKPAERAARVFELETKIALAHWNNVDSRDSEKTYNLRGWDTLADTFSKASPAMPKLSAWRDGMSVPPETFAEIVVRQPSFIEGLGALLIDALLPSWKDWLAWQIIRSAAPYLSKDFVDANFGFYGRTLTGTPKLRERWKRGVSLVEAAMGEAVGRIYVEKHFPTEAKEQMDELVANLVEAYRQSITKLTWMSKPTRQRALDKLSKFTPKIGYPVKWRDYSALQIDANDLIANIRSTAEFEFQRELGKIGQPIDLDEWFMTPQTINAYYNPGFNEIVFPAAILQPPFFSSKRDAAANYGAIGAVIGHEIGHGFDDQGSKFDGDGRLIDWWTEKDRVAFEERTAKLIDQFDTLVPLQLINSPVDEKPHVNGALTIGENIGDLGGLAIAWKAYLISLAGAKPPVIDGLSGAERFFLSWAQAWQLKVRDEEAIRLLAIDPHSPSEFRCNQIVRNIDAFYTGFGVTESDALWLDPEERITIW